MNIFGSIWRSVGPTAPALWLLFLLMTAIVLTEAHLLRRRDMEEKKNEDLLAFVHLLRTAAQTIAACSILVGLSGTLLGLNSKVLPALADALKAGGASEATLGVVGGFQNCFLSTLGGMAVAIEGEIALFLGFLLSGDGDHLGLLCRLLKNVVEERNRENAGTLGTDARRGSDRGEFNRPSAAGAVRSSEPPVPRIAFPYAGSDKEGERTASKSRERWTSEDPLEEEK